MSALSVDLGERLERATRIMLYSKEAPEEIIRIYFEYDNRELGSHALTWIAKGRYLLNNTISSINIKNFKRIKRDEVEKYLKGLGMIS